MAEAALSGFGVRADLCRLAGWLDLPWSGPRTEFHGVCTDSRQVRPGSVFVAIQGPNHDGHDHVAAAAQAGAVAALVERAVAAPLPQLLVPSTRAALGRVGAAWRAELGLPMVAVTGSNGKTTVKEMTAAILRRLGPVLATRGNLNNEIGVPLTLLSLEPEHRFAVVEMGANHPGEIAYLVGLARPDAAVVTNAGPAHLEGFGNLDGVARAKGELFGGVADGGTAVINADDPYAPLWRGLVGGRRTLTFGLDGAADVGAEWAVEADGTRVWLRTPAGAAQFLLALPGRHNVLNALAACALALAVGVDPAVMAAGLDGFSGVAGRLQSRAGSGGSTVIDDTYNANPGSLRAALAVLAERPGERVLVLGDMGELGADAQTLHQQVGEDARACGIERLFTLGTLGRCAAQAFGPAAVHSPDLDSLLAALRPCLGPSTTVLVKGSRSMRMERVVAALSVAED